MRVGQHGEATEPTEQTCPGVSYRPSEHPSGSSNISTVAPFPRCGSWGPEIKLPHHVPQVIDTELEPQITPDLRPFLWPEPLQSRATRLFTLHCAVYSQLTLFTSFFLIFIFIYLVAGDWVWSLGREDTLEEEMATISSSVTLFSSCLQSFPPSGSFPESALRIRWPKYWNFNFSITPSNKCSGLISFRIDWFDLLAVQGTLKSLLQHHSSKPSILQPSAFFMVQLSHPYITTGKNIAEHRPQGSDSQGNQD